MLVSKELCRVLSPGYVLANLRRDGPRFSPKVAALMFEAALEHDGHQQRYKVYDPFCGNGIALAMLQLGYGDWIEWLYGSDVDPESVETTRKNLDIINAPGGIERRVQYLEDYHKAVGRRTGDRAELARTLRRILQAKTDLPRYEVFEANALREDQVVRGIGKVDLVLTDPPYCRDCSWVDEHGRITQANLIGRFLRTVSRHMTAQGKIGLIFDKDVEFEIDGFRLVRKVDLQKRTGYLLIPKDKY
jgi:tRNA G10  N-methylase Trm11